MDTNKYNADGGQHQLAANSSAHVPTTIKGDLRNLPEALAPLMAMPNWVGWRYEWKPKSNGSGDWTKPPVRANNPSQYAKNNDPATWVSYRQAVQAHEAGQCDGIGFNVLNSKFAVLDIDDCRDQSTGYIAPEAMQIVHRAATYCEVSPSGEGLRIIGLGDGPYLQRKLKVPNSKVSVEVYRACERYFTVTGKPLEGGSFPGGLDNIDRLADDLVTTPGGEGRILGEGEGQGCSAG
jgi:primase-polymerase (primpol)-like protein